jgi:hypothetical protein
VFSALVGPMPVVPPVVVPPVVVPPVVVPPGVVPVPVPGEELSVGVEPPPPWAGRLGGGEVGVGGLELPDVGGDVVVLALAVWDVVGVADGAHWLALAPAFFLLPVGLVFALTEAVELAVGVGVAVALAGVVAVLVAAVLLSLGLAVPLAESLAGLVVPLAGELSTDPPGEAFGLTGLPELDGLAAAIDEGLGGHVVAVPLLEPAAVPPEPTAPPPVPIWVAEPAALPAPPLLLEGEENPTAEPKWTRVSRSGGNARTTPMANTAQATASAGRSSPDRQGWGRPRPGSSAPPRSAFQRRTRSARKPPAAPDAFEGLLPWVGPDRTRARIRSSPSGRGSTWSAAACSSRRKNSANSGPCGGMPSCPGLVITPAPGPRAGRPCRGRCGS